jgi:hypothetical protein
VRANNAAGDSPYSNVSGATTPAASGRVVVMALDCGSTTPYTAADGTVYAADAYYSGGSTFTRTDPVNGTTDDPIYQSERYAATLSYDIPMTAGDCTVTLKMQEGYWTAPGQRIFDVTIEGALVMDNLDIYAQAGHDTAYDRQFNVTTDGNLDIDFAASANNAAICGIRLTRDDGVPISPPAAPTSLTAVKDGASPTSKINLSWSNNPTNETGFKIYRSLNGTNFSLVGSVPANVTNYGDAGLAAGATHHYRVYSCNTAGDSATYAAALAATDPDGLIVTISLVGANLRFDFTTASGKQYVLWQSPTLPGWAPAGYQLPGDGTVKSFTIPMPAAENMYYRIEIRL